MQTSFLSQPDDGTCIPSINMKDPHNGNRPWLKNISQWPTGKTFESTVVKRTFRDMIKKDMMLSTSPEA